MFRDWGTRSGFTRPGPNPKTDARYLNSERRERTDRTCLQHRASRGRRIAESDNLNCKRPEAEGFYRHANRTRCPQEIWDTTVEVRYASETYPSGRSESMLSSIYRR